MQVQSNAIARVRARHEAGHCVVAIALGWRPRHVTIRLDRDRQGETAYHARRVDTQFDPDSRMRRLAILFGGMEAERRVARVSIFHLATTAGAGDIDRICAILDESYGPWCDAPAGVRSLRDREEERARRLARDVLAAHWRAVEALTRRLARRETLTGAQAFRSATRADRSLLRAFERSRR